MIAERFPWLTAIILFPLVASLAIPFIPRFWVGRGSDATLRAVNAQSGQTPRRRKAQGNAAQDGTRIKTHPTLSY